MDLRQWVRIMRRARYAQHLDVQAQFPSADFLGPRIVVFNIRHNAYRLVVDMRYDRGRIYVRHIVTHAEYNRLIKRGRL